MIPRMDNPINGYLLRDKRGNLLPGGRLEFFDSTTDAPENVWDAGSGQTVSLGEVVYADAYGLLPDFELTPNLDYKLRCYNSDGDFMWDRDGVANNVSDLLERVEALESAVAALGASSGLRNLLTNGGCKAVRKQTAGATFPVRTSWSLGELAGVFARVTNATEGEFRRTFDGGFGVTGVYAELFDVTTDNSEAEAAFQWRMPSGDGAAISGDDVVFQVKVNQNSGGAIDAQVTLYKCLVADDFTNLVTISSSTPTSVASGVTTPLTLSLNGAGDLSTGVAIVVSFDCGIVANTNFTAGEAQLERGLVATTFEDRPQLLDQAAWSEDDLEGVGELKWFPATSAPPGTVIADGEEINRADYPRLWAWAGTYGRIVDDATWTGDATANARGCFSSGNGSTTFRAPDLISQLAFVRAHDPAGGRSQGDLELDAFQGHHHDFAYNNTPTVDDSPGSGAAMHHSSTSKSADNRVGDPNDDGANGAPRTAEETRPINYGMLPCIKY